MKRYVTSYVGRMTVEVDLSTIQNRSVRGSTLFLRPKTTNVLTEAEINHIKMKIPEVFKFVVVHKEIKPKGKKQPEVKVISSKPKEKEKKPKGKKS